MEIDDVLDKYRQGDPDTRLSLFLYYRELRDEFSRIEEDDMSTSPGTCPASGPIRQGIAHWMLFRRGAKRAV